MYSFKALRTFATTRVNFPRSTVIVAAKRTPVGVFLGKMSNIKATELGSIAINAALDSTGLNPEQIRNEVNEVVLGNVCPAGLGQNPARQAALGAKIPINVPATTVNKVCASGMKTVTYGVQSIALGLSDVVVAGGFESMSNIPFYVTKHRTGQAFGNQQLLDGLAYDGLTDIYNNVAMGLCAEKTATDFKIDRATNDEFAIGSYERAINSIKNGTWRDQIAPVVISEKEGSITEDEEPKKFNKEKMLKLKPVFSKTGTITAANASKINDGGAAILLMSEEKASKLGLKPLARILSFADYEVDPMDFCIAPAKACQIALERAGKKSTDVDYHEINEAFATTVLANMKLLDLEYDRVNIHGGAVALGHPIGVSGARIIMSLMTALKEKKGKLGMASICNGGGGATAILIENLQ
jgi:acetyl-CoA C-acetyltransferase